MEEIRVNSLLMVCLVLGLIVGQSTAAVNSNCVYCLRRCDTQCAKGDNPCLIQCRDGCMNVCKFPISAYDPQIYCHRGCTSSLCRNVCKFATTLYNPQKVCHRLNDCYAPPCRIICKFPTSLYNPQIDCHLGCTSSLCKNLSTQKNKNGKQLQECVDSCNNLCIKA